MKLSPISSLLAAATLGLLSAGPAAQQVWVVDDQPSPGVDFTSIKVAAQAAADGDLVLVRAGTYTDGFLVDGKSLTIAAADGHVVDVEGKKLISNLSPGQSVEVIDIHTTRGANFSGFFGGINVEDSAGSVQIIGGTHHGVPLNPGILVRDSSNVTIVQAELIGDDASVAGLRIIDSDVSAYNSSMLGGVGFAGSFVKVEPGEGVHMQGGSLFAAGCSLEGGQGMAADANKSCNNKGTKGGIGLHIDDQGGVATLRDCSVKGGKPGSVGGTLCEDNGGEAIVVREGSATFLSQPARAFHLPAVAFEGDSATIEFSGQNGDVCYWLFSAQAAPAYFEAAVGMVIPGGALQVLNVGTITQGGPLTMEFLIPNLTPEFVRIYEQSMVLTSQGFVMGDPQVSLLVKGSYDLDPPIPQ